MTNILTKNCLVCSRLFEKPINESKKNWVHRHKYCSKVCADKSPRTQETKDKQRLAKLGKSSWNKGKPHTEEHKKNLRGKRKKFKDTSKMTGRRPWNKIGERGVTSINERIRKSPKYKEWRKSVFERDDYTCQNCGKRGGNMHADHIKPFFAHPELRFEMANGRTLCIPCHRATDTYGSRHYYQMVKTI